MQSTKLERSILREANHPFVVHLRFSFQTPAKLYLVTGKMPGVLVSGHLTPETALRRMDGA